MMMEEYSTYVVWVGVLREGEGEGEVNDLVLVFLRGLFFFSKKGIVEIKKKRESKAVHLIPFLQMYRNHDRLRHFFHVGKSLPPAPDAIFTKPVAKGRNSRPSDLRHATERSCMNENEPAETKHDRQKEMR